MKVSVSTNKEVEGRLPNYPNLAPQLICQLHDATMHVSNQMGPFFFFSWNRSLKLTDLSGFRQMRRPTKCTRK